MNNTCVSPYQPHAPLLQPFWDYILRHEELLLSPYLPAGVAFLGHVFMCAPFLLMDVMGSRWTSIHRYKISDSREETVCLRLWLSSFLRIFWKYAVYVFPATAVLQRLRTPEMPTMAPTCWQVFWQISSCLFLFDALFYFWHDAMHRVPWLYFQVHRAHHRNTAVFAMIAQDSSASELLSLQTIAICCAVLVGCHPLSEIIFHLLNMWMAVEDHCGYDLPWALHRIVPFFGGAPFHQLHHRRFRGNYAPYFTHWDRLFGTYLEEEETP
ncbi:cholesterol 25-hydroxylase-like protein [Conger conger]|uniref:cholesterol 25-hydroxylase-like protein n=1 Tax=Conger conger TaxID=82655 RepID=UPI002A5AE495|nr:cholesterol 25-hydroxylase-like protein [Conger conger]